MACVLVLHTYIHQSTWQSNEVPPSQCGMVSLYACAPPLSWCVCHRAVHEKQQAAARKQAQAEPAAIAAAAGEQADDGEAAGSEGDDDMADYEKKPRAAEKVCLHSQCGTQRGTKD